ncbi:MAG: prolyl oligopeptidase family serine peptidase [Gammaproteobacteria bacterium]|nr:prolyl oligopeptidase family serine peptidase [Gammaproteobacteria bacterium]MCW5583955.1 prolyl oligopeptidase family serine peptidase [Gammaproteobacteria bacterium]
MSRVKRSTTRVKGFNDPEMDFQLLRMLGVASYGGSSIGECLSTVTHIQNNDPDEWVRAYSTLANEIKNLAEEAHVKQHFVSAKDYYLKACNYYRSAEYYADPFGPIQRELGLASRSCFIQATTLFETPTDIVEIPYENSWMPGYFIRPAKDNQKRSTVIIVTGFDGSGEEMYFQCAAGALQRNFNVLIFEGPGQTGMLRLHPELKFRPDYEVPIRCAIDYALSRKEVDPNKLALYGISFGGYFVARGAAHDSRIKAVIPNSPIVDLQAYLMAFIGTEAQSSPQEDIKLDEIDAIPNHVIPKGTKLGLKSSFFKFGAISFLEWMTLLNAFKVGDKIKNIHCPSLILVGEGEGDESLKQATHYEQNVSGPVTKRIFTVQEGADTHCQLGNLPLSCAVTYDWLSDLFAKNS